MTQPDPDRPAQPPTSQQLVRAALNNQMRALQLINASVTQLLMAFPPGESSMGSPEPPTPDQWVSKGGPPGFIRDKESSD